MKLASIRTMDGLERLCGVSELGFLDLHVSDPELPKSLLELLTFENGLSRAEVAFAAAKMSGSVMEGTLIAPIPRPGKILCIGLNYRDHALETRSEIPSEPVVFSKFSNTIIGTEQPICIPAVARQVDYEAELVAVIGQRAHRVPGEQALACVAGYMNGHDVSARDWQKGRPGGQWLLGKSPDTFAPIGPWLVTADSVGDPHQLSVVCRVNGEVLQQGNTRDFIFDLPTLIAHISQLITLEPGDLIFTGTPAGVGAARSPQRFLNPGDVVEIEIEGLGVLRNPVEGESPR